ECLSRTVWPRSGLVKRAAAAFLKLSRIAACCKRERRDVATALRLSLELYFFQSMQEMEMHRRPGRGLTILTLYPATSQQDPVERSKPRIPHPRPDTPEHGAAISEQHAKRPSQRRTSRQLWLISLSVTIRERKVVVPDQVPAVLR